MVTQIAYDIQIWCSYYLLKLKIHLMFPTEEVVIHMYSDISIYTGVSHPCMCLIHAGFSPPCRCLTSMPVSHIHAGVSHPCRCLTSTSVVSHLHVGGVSPPRRWCLTSTSVVSHIHVGGVSHPRRWCLTSMSPGGV